MSERKQEDEYFARQNAAKLAELRAQEVVEGKGAKFDELKALHFHRCGHCGGQMATEGFRGVEVEICGNCGSVLLNQGELQKLAGRDQTDFFTGIVSLFGGK